MKKSKHNHADHAHVLKDTPRDRHPDAFTVTEVRHWDDRLFSFKTERPQSLRFRSGEFVMIGLMGDNDRPIMRAYSIASPSWDETLEFYSIKVPDGPLTSRLQNIQARDEIILRPKPVGTLVLDALTPGKRLFLVCTGTGFAPFASLIRDPQVYEAYDEVFVLHTVRELSELDYAKSVVEDFRDNALLEDYREKLTYYGTTTREESAHMGRCSDLLASGEIAERLGIDTLDDQTDRVMICGSLALNEQMKALLKERGFNEGANSQPAEFVIEKAFVGEGI